MPIYLIVTKQYRYKNLQKHLSESIKTKKIGLLTVNLLTTRFPFIYNVCLIFNVKRKKEHHPLLNPRKALLTLPLHLGSPYWLPTLLQLLFSELLKFLTSLAYYLSELVACCANCCSECYYCCENHS